MLRTLMVIPVVGLLACGGQMVNQNVEALVTVKSGIYGQTTRHDDVGSHPEEVNPNFEVSVFAVPAGSTLGPAVATTRSDAQGFYEVSLTPDDYVVCTSFKRCVKSAVPASSPVRLDYSFSVGPGWSAGTHWP